jgi:lipopolysaccharide export system protein LptA
MMRIKLKIYFFLLFIAVAGTVVAQRADSTRPGKVIEIRVADRYNYQDKDTSGKFISLAGHAFVQQDKIKFYADSIVLNQKDNIMEAFGNVHINDADSVNIYSQYLKYLSKERKAYLKQNVKLTDGKGVLTTNELEYDTQLKIGKYFNGGKVVNRKTTITSIEGSYYGDTRDVYFRKNVLLISPDYRIITDTLLYNFNSEIATFVSPSTIYNGKRIITVRDGYYDLKHKKATFYQRPFVNDSTYTFTADNVAYDDSTGLGEAQGNAVYRSKDSIGGYDIIANNIKTNKKKESFLATQSPILFLKQEKDTIYISADTLYSAKISDLIKSRNIPNIRDTSHLKIKPLTLKPGSSKDSSKNRFFEAYYHVKIFSDSLQAIGDSLFYSLEDSTFRLLKNPVTWAQENQITGDTIYMYLQNRKPERLYVFENAMAISKESKDYFNQVRGNNINALFKGGKINFIKTKGSPAENVYYAVDDNLKFVGVNKSSSDVINVYFTEGKPQKVVFVNNLEGTLYPMQQVNHEEIKVRKFQWLDDKRPKSKFDILSN